MEARFVWKYSAGTVLVMAAVHLGVSSVPARQDRGPDLRGLDVKRTGLIP